MPAPGALEMRAFVTKRRWSGTEARVLDMSSHFSSSASICLRSQERLLAGSTE
ncbi:Uncharacterised protein [Mycobacterium tuberculosis]|nr:Uncharacterised protein [Mycobacterium tuberculosis]